jgi:hypothetical protein
MTSADTAPNRCAVRRNAIQAGMSEGSAKIKGRPTAAAPGSAGDGSGARSLPALTTLPPQLLKPLADLLLEPLI